MLLRNITPCNFIAGPDRRLMKVFDEICLTPIGAMTPERIREIRRIVTGTTATDTAGR